MPSVRLHYQQPLLQRGGLYRSRLRRRHEGSAGRRDPPDRQSGNPLSRGSSAHAARGALAAKLNMTISPETAEPLPRLPPCSPRCAAGASVRRSAQAAAGRVWLPDLHAAGEYSLFQPLFPDHHPLLYRARRQPDGADHQPGAEEYRYRIHNDMRVNPAFLFAVMFCIRCWRRRKIAQESG